MCGRSPRARPVARYTRPVHVPWRSVRAIAAPAPAPALASALALAVLAVAGCGDDLPPGGALADAAAGGDADPRGRRSLGEVVVAEHVYPAPWGAGRWTYLEAAFEVAGYRRHLFHAETARAGDCRVLEPHPGTCRTCTGICVGPETCAPYPVYASAGGLELAGGGDSVILRRDPLDGRYQTRVRDEPFAPGATVTATAAGDEVAGFTAAARGVTPLVAELPADGKLRLGAEPTVRWTPADPGARVRLTLNGDGVWHGGHYLAIIECEVDDAAGAITVPAALMARFPDTTYLESCSFSKCAFSHLARLGRGTAVAGDGAVELRVEHRQHVWAIHDPSP